MRTSIQMLADTPDVASAIARIEMSTHSKIRQLLELVGITTISYLRSLTDEMRPPASADRPPRRAHPGHWADITSQLALGYSWEIEERGPAEIALVLRNVVEYAIYVDVMEGFFVLRGIADPGGLVYQAIQRAMPIVAPEWKWRTV